MAHFDCPRCGRRLSAASATIAGERYEFEPCADCGGAWVGPGLLAEIRRRVQASLGPSPRSLFGFFWPQGMTLREWIAEETTVAIVTMAIAGAAVLVIGVLALWLLAIVLQNLFLA